MLLTYHINKHLQRTLPLLHELGRIVLLPLLLLVLAKVALESFLPPGCVDRVGNGRKSGYGLVHSRVLEEL